jgi:secreted trypsin-like serine protease
MQGSTSTRRTPGRSAGRGRLLAVLAALLVSVFVLFLEGGAPAQAIVGGTQVKVGGTQAMPVMKYPFMVALVANWDPTREPQKHLFCGGTLIDKDSVLTGAHCFEGISDADVDAGKVDVIVGATELGAEPIGQGVVRDVLRFWHPSAYDLQNPTRADRRLDVGVITLNQPVTTKNAIQLATESHNYLEGRLRTATVAGWGVTKNCPKNNQGKADCSLLDEQDQQQKHLLEAKVPLWGDQEAEGVLPLVSTFKFYPTYMVAAGGFTKSACRGDSGGPLFAKDNQGRYTQIGIAAAAWCNPALSLTPDVYTEVNNPSIRNFILWASKR